MAAISIFGKSAWRPRTILLSEPEDERIIMTSRMAKDKGFATPFPVWNKKTIEKTRPNSR